MRNQNQNEEKFAKKLREINQSTTLDLRGICIGDAEAKEIAEALKVSKSLTSLDLRATNIRDSGAKESPKL